MEDIKDEKVAENDGGKEKNMLLVIPKEDTGAEDDRGDGVAEATKEGVLSL